MSPSLRWSEKWFRRGLWLVAIVFAGFLVGLGGAVVGDLPRVEGQLLQEDFVDPARAEPLRQSVADGRATLRQAQDTLDQARLQLQAAHAATRSARESFSDWVATRRATEQPSQDSALIARTRALEALQAEERTAQQAVQAQQQRVLDAQQAIDGAQRQLETVTDAADEQWGRALRAAELRVFLYRLAITLPLLAAAGWLFVRKRHGTYWPFAWGFIFFAGFTFFVELVPYLPSYGGYVRSGVGIVLTVLIGRYAIAALNRYLSRQQQAEQMSDAQRRHALGYDTAQARLAKEVCPGCERSVNFKDASIDFCPHCGIGLFNRCTPCGARKSTFARYCQACGSAAPAGPPVPAPATPAA